MAEPAAIVAAPEDDPLGGPCIFQLSSGRVGVMDDSVAFARVGCDGRPRGGNGAPVRRADPLPAPAPQEPPTPWARLIRWFRATIWPRTPRS